MRAEPPTGAVRIARVERDLVLQLRCEGLGGHGHRVGALRGDLAPSTRHWAALVGDTVVGCVSVMRLRGWALRAMAVASSHRRQGVGGQLLGVVCGEVDAPMWCNARLDAVPFYVHQGWIPVGPVFTIEDRGPHQRMTWSPALP